MTGFITLQNLSFYASHGVSTHEKASRQRFYVSLRLRLKMGAAATRDTLSDTIDYDAVYALVAKEMNTQAHLLEHLAYRIIQTLFKALPLLDAVCVRVQKKDLQRKRKAAVELELTRSEEASARISPPGQSYPAAAQAKDTSAQEA